MNYIDELKKYFGYESFINNQEKVISTLLDTKKHCLVLMPTGGGKSICYQLPALLLEGGTIVISPLIALMQDQVDALKKKNIPADFINSSISAELKEKRLRNFVNGKTKILYVTPERFRKRSFIDEIKQAKISLLAVDEAHCISEWGTDFRPDYSRILEFRELLKNPLTIALTATATKEVQADIIDKLCLQKVDVTIFHEGIHRPNLKLEVINAYDEKEVLYSLQQILKNYNGSGIIYFSLIKTLEYYSEKLSDLGFKHSIYHGKLPAEKRKKVQRDFISDHEQIILATNAFGMGIDKPNIRFVVHAEVPSSIEAYYQEIGRAGRDGEPSNCTLLYRQDDLYTQMEFIKWANPNSDFYYRIYNILLNNNIQVNQLGIDYLREEMSFKDKYDFRVETALAILDRWGVTEGNLGYKNLEVVSELPEHLQDDKFLNSKLLNDNKKLLSVVNYTKTDECRHIFVAKYFGFDDEKRCGTCDVCLSEN